MKNSTKYLAVALKAAKQSGPLFKQHFGHAGKAKMKHGDPRNLVTKIDLEIEKNIRKVIETNFPGSKIIGEEFGSSKLKADDIVWIIDPIDGTTNYIQGIPLSCISIGVWDKNGPLAGVVFNPILNQIYTAELGKGAYLNGKKINVSKVSSLKSALGGIGWISPKKGIKIFKSAVYDTRKLRVLATSAWQTCMVASGQFDFYATNDVSIWDVAAGLIVLSEAGGVATTLNGQPLNLDLKEIFASNSKIHQELLNKMVS